MEKEYLEYIKNFQNSTAKPLPETVQSENGQRHEHTSKEDSKNHTGRCSTSLASRGLQIQTTGRCHHDTLVRKAKRKLVATPNAGGDAGRLEPSFMAGRTDGVAAALEDTLAVALKTKYATTL